jgi:hypothetical protein
LFPVRYEVGRLAAVIGLSALVALVAAPLPATAWAFPVKCGLLVLWPVAVWLSGFVSAEEKAHVHGLIGWMAQSTWRPRRVIPETSTSAA